MRYATFAEIEQLLLTAIGLPGRSIKEIAQATGIQANTLYKWKTTSVHLSPEKSDRLLLYFIANEPTRLDMAKALLNAPYPPLESGTLRPPMRSAHKMRSVPKWQISREGRL